ncbi:hypothetical protein Aduo_007048 [Ancylostoma duodenale]
MTTTSTHNGDIDVVSEIRAHSTVGRIAFVEGEEYNEAITFDRLYHAALAVCNYLSCLYIKGVQASIFLANRWEMIAFYLGVRLYGGSVRILDYSASEDQLAMAFEGSKIVLCEGADIMKVFRGTLEKHVKLITLETEQQPYNAISMNDVLRIRINRTLPQNKVMLSQRTVSMLMNAVTEIHPGWNPMNGLYAAVASLHRPVQIELIMACLSLGLPVLMIDIRKLNNFIHYSKNHAIDVVSVDEASLQELRERCTVPLQYVEIVLFDGIITENVKLQLLEVFPRARAIKEG